MNLSWIEISKSALLNNVAQIKKNLKTKTKYIAVIKSNAYGHGLLEVASTIKDKVDYFAVYNFDDAILLRQNKISKPILMLGRLFPQQISKALKNDIEISVSNLDILEAAKKLNKNQKLKIHLCIDSGLGRDGFIKNDAKKVLQLLHNKIDVIGLYTHFSAPDYNSFDNYTKKQAEELLWWKKQLTQKSFKPIVHAASTAGSFIKKFECEFDAVRIGGGTYGLWSSDEVEKKNYKRTILKPSLSWKTKVVEIKELKKGSAISYGCTFTLKHNAKIAILPTGYFDGIPRCTSNKGKAIINGTIVPQIGRVTMNMIIVDVTKVKNLKIGDDAILIGSSNNKQIKAEDWGEWSNSFNYEITTRINSGLARVVTK